MKATIFLCIASAAGLVGCASAGYPVTFNSVPQGATVVCGDTVLPSPTPVTSYYNQDMLDSIAASRRERFEDTITDTVEELYALKENEITPELWNELAKLKAKHEAGIDIRPELEAGKERLLARFEAQRPGISKLRMEEIWPGLCNAHWASGATSKYDISAIDTKTRPKGASLMANYPGDQNARAIDEARAVQTQQMQLQQQQVQLQQPIQQPIPVYQPQPLPVMPTTSFPSAPGRATTVCRTLSNGTVVCD